VAIETLRLRAEVSNIVEQKARVSMLLSGVARILLILLELEFVLRHAGMLGHELDCICGVVLDWRLRVRRSETHNEHLNVVVEVDCVGAVLLARIREDNSLVRIYQNVFEIDLLF
jgi:hypothetical protein